MGAADRMMNNVSSWLTGECHPVNVNMRTQLNPSCVEGEAFSEASEKHRIPVGSGLRFSLWRFNKILWFQGKQWTKRKSWNTRNSTNLVIDNNTWTWSFSVFWNQSDLWTKCKNRQVLKKEKLKKNNYIYKKIVQQGLSLYLASNESKTQTKTTK